MKNKNNKYCGIGNHILSTKYNRCKICDFDMTKKGSVAESLDFFVYISDYTWFINDPDALWNFDRNINVPAIQLNTKLYSPQSKILPWLWAGHGKWLGSEYNQCMIIEQIPLSKVIKLVSKNIGLKLIYHIDVFND